MQKKIKPYAIVPKELYVTREADRQLRQIVEDMGRPGYVLVSRQMGKTNLLLNAKRDFDSNDNCFCYLDVSNSFSDLRSFFRNIIDIILISKTPLLNSTKERIQASRSKSEDLQPHKEHELELREVLNTLPGKLIICLDEIDALTKVNYSDNVFSLIRSIYFSGRTNFPQFERLTYILSGVADPADLIKNKAISPFNIGEKIYLNDFTLLETKRFLDQCSLPLNDDIIERVYHWTSGSPRATWDICSAIESDLADNPRPNIDSIDSHVRTLYLTNFDLPPFDHIRARVEIDREIRSAVMTIHYGKSASLSDKIKDKLYLAGISTPKKKDGSVAFKNKIMSESLSEKWITDIERQTLTLEERAANKLHSNEYQEAISLYQELLAESEKPDSIITAKLNIGFCFTQLEDFKSALEVFESCELGDNPNQSLIDFKSYWSGICLLFSDRVNESIAQFRKIAYPVDEKYHSSFYSEACINLASALMSTKERLSDLEDHSEIPELILKAISAEDELQKSGKPTLARNILYTANYQLSRYYGELGNIDLGIAHIEEALAIASENVKCTLTLARANLEPNLEAKNELYKKCSSLYISSRLALSKNELLNSLYFSENECADLIANLVLANESTEASRLLSYIDSGEPRQPVNAWNLILKVLLELISREQFIFIPLITKLALPYTNQAPEEELKNLLSLSLLLEVDEEPNSVTAAYQELLSQDSYVLSGVDFRPIFQIISIPLAGEDYEKCHSILDHADRAFKRSLQNNILDEDTAKFGALVLIYLRVRSGAFYEKNYPIDESLIKFLPVILEANKFSLPYFPDDFGDFFDSELRKLVHEDFYRRYETPPSTQLIASKKIGRNAIVRVKYADGKIESGKFKKFLAQIESGECELIPD
ncbi:hypothetical protein PSm6_49840 [Pseudomonas solani]|uniref:Uncharacterized protein n=1 Tax=Pseudomonas solani TaxID=2731552 RepID=A0ABM7LG44_9PSED|nr:AAA-like domain-containing protein [Pseudomonas solani]BCD88577.1 hypothetical protein PSm6_49840 [Pseudomonas solani]